MSGLGGVLAKRMPTQRHTHTHTPAKMVPAELRQAEMHRKIVMSVGAGGAKGSRV